MGEVAQASGAGRSSRCQHRSRVVLTRAGGNGEAVGTIDRAPAHRAAPRRRTTRSLAAALTAVVVGLVTAVGGSLLAPPTASAAPADAQPGGRREHRRQPDRTRGDVPTQVQAGDVHGARADLELPDHRDRAHRLDRGCRPTPAAASPAGSGPGSPPPPTPDRRSGRPAPRRRSRSCRVTAYRSSGPSPTVTASAQARLQQPGDQPHHAGGPGRRRGLLARQRLGREVGRRHRPGRCRRARPSAPPRPPRRLRQGEPGRRRLQGAGGDRHGRRSHRHHQHLGQPQCAVLGRGEPRGRRQPSAGGGLLVQLRRARLQLRRRAAPATPTATR